MLSVAQAMTRRGSAGVPLPDVYPSLKARGARICRSQLTLVVGPASAGKSMLTFNLLARMGVPALGFLLDTDELTASARFASIVTNEPFVQIKDQIIAGQGDHYREAILARMPYVQASFHAPTADQVALEMDAFEARYGVFPHAVLVDNLGNQTSQFGDEWAVLKALTLEYDQMARATQSAVIACHHTTDLESCEPAQRTKILGRISQYARLILSVGFNPETGEYKVAIVKNSSGRTDAAALHPVCLYGDPARMLLREYADPDPIVTGQPMEPAQGAWDFS